MLSVELSAVIVAISNDMPRVLVVRDGRGPDALPSGPFDLLSDRTLETGLRRWVSEQTQLDLGYVEQLYTFGDRFRTPAERDGGPRAISIGYLALARTPKSLPEPLSAWAEWYAYFPWEDHRDGMPPEVPGEIVPQLIAWAERGAGEAQARAERIDLAFGRGGRWDEELVLQRYELLYEAGLVAEAASPGHGFGRPMDSDHRRILATAIGRLRGKIKYRPVVFELLAPAFTLLELQRSVEALAGLRLHTANFRRLIDNGGLVESTGRFQKRSRGRPAEEFRFRREVVLERSSPGVQTSRQRMP